MTQRLSIKVDSSGMAAWIVVATGDAAGRREFEAALAAAGVTKGVLPELAASIISKIEDGEFSCAGELIAQGQESTPGIDGCMEFELPTTVTVGTMHSHERIDYRERNAAHNVELDQLIAIYQPPTEGRVGFTVKGARLLPDPVLSGLLELGEGVAIQPDTDSTTNAKRILSTRPGVVVHVAELSLDVTDLYHHEGDVDYTIGNLDVRGTAWVSGSVQPNFSVRASADVIIDDNIDHGSVHAGGNLRVGNGIIGTDTNGIQAKGNISCRFTSNSAMIAGGELHIDEHSTGCDLQAQHLNLREGRGRIAGGRARTEHSIYVLEAGSNGDVETLLEAGLPLQELSDLRRGKRAEKRQDRSRIKAHRRGERRSKGGKHGRESAKLARQARGLNRAVRQRERELLQTAEIVILNRTHAGVTLKIGPCTLRLLEPTAGGRFVYQEETDSIVQQDLPQ